MTEESLTPVAAPDARGRVAELHAIRDEIGRGPSEKATAAQHAKGKLTARERIELLLDEGSFQEVEGLRRHRATGFGLEAKRPYTDGVITGWAPSTAVPSSSTRTTSGSSAGRSGKRTPEDPQDHGHGHRGGRSAGLPQRRRRRRIQEGVSALAGYGGIFQRNTKRPGSSRRSP